MHKLTSWICDSLTRTDGKSKISISIDVSVTTSSLSQIHHIVGRIAYYLQSSSTCASFSFSSAPCTVYGTARTISSTEQSSQESSNEIL